MFQHLHIHSYYSMMWGTAPLEALAEELVRQGQDTFPLTDRNGTYGMVKHIQVCQEYGLRPIIGSQLVTARHDALCLVKTREGYRNLNLMLTAYNHDPNWQLDEALEQHHKGLVIITACEDLVRNLYPEADLFVDLRPGHTAQAERLHKSYGAPLVVTSHAYTISENAHRLHLLMRAIDTNSKLSRMPDDQYLQPGTCLYPIETMIDRFAAWPDALRATHEIAEACVFVPEIGKHIYPPSDHDHNYQVLREKTYAGLHRRYGRLNDTITQRADHELDMIRRKGFSNCFLVVEDVVQHFSLTCGRGSAAAGIVSYALAITHVDPIAHNLFFERFLNPGRVDPPDIDIDFAWDERDRVRDYLWQKYGRKHIAMVCNQNRLRPRSTIRELAKVYGMGEQEMKDVALQLQKARKGGPKPDLKEPWPEIMRLARRLEDYPRQLSVHCGGVVITPDEITNHCPLRPMPIGYDVIPWEKDGAEDYGFVKLDFLGNRSLAVIRDALSAVNDNYGVKIAYDSFNPLGDPRARALIQNGETMGCFYVESPATRQLLQKTRMGDYETLTAISSIIRPAANKVAAEWVKRHRWSADPANKPNWKCIHPKLDEVLHETHGLMVYQEDVTRTAMALAGFDAVAGDKLRKVLSKKDYKKLADFRDKFIQGCRDNGLDKDQIGEIWEMMESFAGYSFCKPHSASYALVSFKSAFLKAHYPAEFMAAVISNQGGFYSAYAYLSHARRLGLEVLGPDVNDSFVPYRGYNGVLRMGLMQIKGLKRQTSEAVVAERKEGGAFHSLEDFLQRVPITLEEAKRMILAGCFDDLEPDSNRPSLNWRALYWFALHQRQSEDLFPDYIRREDLPKMEPYSLNTRLKLERKLFGFPLSRHPLAPFKEEIDQRGRVRARDIINCCNRRIMLAGVLITGKTVRTHKGEAMTFLTFEDETGTFESVMFPDVYSKRAHLLDYARPYMVHGEVVSDMGAISLTVNELQRLV